MLGTPRLGGVEGCVVFFFAKINILFRVLISMPLGSFVLWLDGRGNFFASCHGPIV